VRAGPVDEKNLSGSGWPREQRTAGQPRAEADAVGPG
jgi:hypothetical protein